MLRAKKKPENLISCMTVPNSRENTQGFWEKTAVCGTLGFLEEIALKEPWPTSSIRRSEVPSPASLPSCPHLTSRLFSADISLSLRPRSQLHVQSFPELGGAGAVCTPGRSSSGGAEETARRARSSSHFVLACRESFDPPEVRFPCPHRASPAAFQGQLRRCRRGQLQLPINVPFLPISSPSKNWRKNQRRSVCVWKTVVYASVFMFRGPGERRGPPCQLEKERGEKENECSAVS